MKLKIDLHIHSIYSDGLDTPFQIASEVKKKCLDVFSITDHDTILGLDEKINEAKKIGVKFLKGIELSAYNGNQVHILGYNFDENNCEFLKKMDELSSCRIIRGNLMIEKLKKFYNIEISSQDIARTSPNNFGSMHLAQALVKKGFAENVKDAFNKYIGFGQKAYVGDNRIDPFTAISIIKKAGGVAVLAHPKQIKMGDEEKIKFIKTLKDNGLDGIEASYSSHTLKEIENYKGVAVKFDLFVTNGSDYHGNIRSERIGVPEYFLDKKALDSLKIEI